MTPDRAAGRRPARPAGPDAAARPAPRPGRPAGRLRGPRVPRLLRLAAAAATVLAIALTGPAAAASPFPSPDPGRSVYDPDAVLRPATLRTAETAADAVEQATGIRPVIVVRRAATPPTADETTAAAVSLAGQWQLDRAVLMLVDAVAKPCGGQVAVVPGTGVDPATLSNDVIAAAQKGVSGFLADCDPDSAVLVGLSNLATAAATAGAFGGGSASSAPGASTEPVASGAAGSSDAPGASVVPAASGGSNKPASAPSARPIPTVRPGASAQVGPPFPDPVNGQYVYDQAHVFSSDTIAKVQAQIQAIRDRTGAEVVVYTQVKPGVDTSEAEADAQALMDQWGVGRRGFDDGLVILFDLDQSRKHGQVQLYAGPGYRAAFLSNGERQAIYQDDMLPLLKAGDLDGALQAAMAKVDANATPEHAATLNRARQINAVVGLVGAPVVFLLLVGWPVLHWLRFGRDPAYLDDPSILMPAPPPDLTAAAGALVFDGRSSRHTLTTAMLDLASRDEIAFRPEEHRFGKDKMGIEMRRPDVTDPRIALNRRRPISAAEVYARDALAGIAAPDATGADMIDSKTLLTFGPKVGAFDTQLELYVVQKGWFTRTPKSAVARWVGQGTLEFVGGVVLAIVGGNLPSDGLVLVAVALMAAGVITAVIARAMPARTLAGATIRAMLAAYRRTLEKTFAMSRSMDQVVASKAVPWLETPDQAVVWGVALGLREDVESVLGRTASDLSAGRADPRTTYVPAWYGPSGWGSSGGPGGSGGIAPGLFSGSAVPNFGGMMAAIGTIGNSPSSSGGGGFGGGGSGGGGGGAGGGF